MSACTDLEIQGDITRASTVEEAVTYRKATLARFGYEEFDDHQHGGICCYYAHPSGHPFPALWFEPRALPTERDIARQIARRAYAAGVQKEHNDTASTLARMLEKTR